MDIRKCRILHVDMDAFFAAVEQRDRPELRGKPVIVGAPANRRGVVSTASYEARRFGIHSAMPSRTAYRLCPHGIFVPVRGEVYAQVSRQIMDIFFRFTPLVEQVSIDEAFLDLTGSPGAADPVAVGRQLKETIRKETHLTASVGVACNKFLAKLASDLKKPDGLSVVPPEPDEIRKFLAPLPVTRIWGVGKVTAEILSRAGITRIGQLQEKTLPELGKLLGPASAIHVHRLALGKDDRTLELEHEEKSISNEETFDSDCSDPHIVRRTLTELAEKVGARLRSSGKAAGTGQIRVRFSDFTTITRQRGFSPPTASDREILKCAYELYDREQIRQPVRLVGFGVSKFFGAERKQQPLLFDLDELQPENSRDSRLDAAVDEIRRKYGTGIIRRGR